MNSLLFLSLLLAGIVAAVLVLGKIVGAILGLLFGGLSLAWGALTAIGSSLLGLMLGGIGVMVGLGFGAITVLVPLAILVLPFVLLGMLLGARRPRA